MTSEESRYRNASSVFWGTLWWLLVVILGGVGEYFMYKHIPKITEFTVVHFVIINASAVAILGGAFMMWRTLNTDRYIDDQYARDSYLEAEPG